MPEASPALQAQALSFQPPPGDAGIYIICPEYFMGGSATWDVSLDRQKCSALKIGSFLHTPVWPGEHTVTDPDDGDHSSITFVVNQGQNCFITTGPSLSGNDFNVVSPETGANYVRQYQMSGDDFYQLPFLPDAVDSSVPVACHVVLAQDDPFVISRVDQPANLPSAAPSLSGTSAQQGEEAGAAVGASFFEGFVDAMVTGVANNERSVKAKKMSLLLQGHGIGQSFRTNFQSSLVAAIDKSPWLHAASIDMARKNTNALAAEIDQHPVMQINLIYGLAPDASALTVRAELLYFRQGQTNATYDRLYSYVSEPLSVEDSKAITQWTASNQALMRQRMDEGTSELITMMDMDFFHREQMDPNQRSKRISFDDPFDGRQIGYNGFVLRNDGRRIIFQRRSGNMFSVVGDVVPPPTPPSNAVGKLLYDIYVQPNVPNDE